MLMTVKWVSKQRVAAPRKKECCLKNLAVLGPKLLCLHTPCLHCAVCTVHCALSECLFFFAAAAMAMCCFQVMALLGLVLLVDTIQSSRPSTRPSSALQGIDCHMQWYTQTLDHFSFAPSPFGPTYQQRYCVSAAHWRAQGPIFFYTGNEGPVETYIQNTGLIWEHAPRFGALVVFAEHRYYGQSQPCGPQSWRRCPHFLTSEQALADYAALLHHLRDTFAAPDAPAVAFGGSYGGMLAAWLRAKYPHVVAGAVAASAPVWAFPGLPRPWDPSEFWAIVTRDATAAAGTPDDCAHGVGEALQRMFALAASVEGRQLLSRAFRLCHPLQQQSDAEALGYWVQGAFDNMAMGNYPFPSSYISGDPAHPLPAWPMRVACQHLHNVPRADESALLTALRDAAGVVYNASQQLQCFSLDPTGPAAGADDIWDYQFCTELLPQEMPYFQAKGPPFDMFWKQTHWTMDTVVQHCQEKHGVVPRTAWVATYYGDLSQASNIVFSYGEYDPWSAGCIRSNISQSLISVQVPQGAHHLDLMFSTAQDPPAVAAVRALEMQHVATWVRAGHAAQTGG